jgi:hypothetical protein
VPGMASNQQPDRRPSEFDPSPGEARDATDRAVKARRDAARKAGQHVPPIARPYNGWDRS